MDTNRSIQWCDCHGTGRGHAFMGEVVAAEGALVVKDRQHGTHHTKTWTLPEFVSVLDPDGTTYTRVEA